MLKKLKSSLVFICLISLLTGCVNQNQEVTSDQEITVTATSIAVTEILDQLIEQDVYLSADGKKWFDFWAGGERIEKKSV